MRDGSNPRRKGSEFRITETKHETPNFGVSAKQPFVEIVEVAGSRMETLAEASVNSIGAEYLLEVAAPEIGGSTGRALSIRDEAVGHIVGGTSVVGPIVVGSDGDAVAVTIPIAFAFIHVFVVVSA